MNSQFHWKGGSILSVTANQNQVLTQIHVDTNMQLSAALIKRLMKCDFMKQFIVKHLCLAY